MQLLYMGQHKQLPMGQGWAQWGVPKGKPWPLGWSGLGKGTKRVLMAAVVLAWPSARGGSCHIRSTSHHIRSQTTLGLVWGLHGTVTDCPLAPHWGPRWTKESPHHLEAGSIGHPL